LLARCAALVNRGAFAQFSGTSEDVAAELARSPNARPDARQRRLLAQARQSFTAMVPEARKVAGMPRGRFPVTLGGDPRMIALPGRSECRWVAAALQLDMLERLDAGDVATATTDVLALVNVGGAMGDEPFAVSMLIRMAAAANRPNSWNR
jgi:hypothetical protein